MLQYDVSGNPPEVLMRLEAAISQRGFVRTGALGLGENDRLFDGRYGCLATLFMSTSQRVKVSAIAQDGGTTRLLVTANKHRNLQAFDKVLVQEFGATKVP